MTIFRRVFIEFVILLTKVCPKILIYSVTAKYGERVIVQSAVFSPPPFTPRSD